MMRIDPRLQENVARFRTAWLMRREGKKLREIGAALGVTVERTRQILAGAERRMIKAASVYFGPVADPIAYGVWHEFTPAGREGIKIDCPSVRQDRKKHHEGGWYAP